MKLRFLSGRRWMALGGVVALAVIVVVALHLAANRPVISSYIGQTLTYSTSKPSETKPTAANFTWQGAASDPKYITLPTIGAEGYIEKVGVDQHHQVGVPDNIYMAAWFAPSVSPGRKGLSIIDGHVTGWHGPGIFRYLANLKKGDGLSITLGSGEVLDYTIMQNSSVPLDQVTSVLFSQDPSVMSQLNLITCSGQFDYQTSSYAQREVVTAKLISPLQT